MGGWWLGNLGRVLVQVLGRRPVDLGLERDRVAGPGSWVAAGCGKWGWRMWFWGTRVVKGSRPVEGSRVIEDSRVVVL